MKQKSLTISLLICAVLAAALLLSVVALISAKSEISALEDQVHALSAQLDAASARSAVLPIMSNSILPRRTAFAMSAVAISSSVRMIRLRR